MPLPNPHGDSSGQIAHQAVYDIGDTPTSTGGKFIGFGEEGTSYIANRAHWALSENIDYVYQIIAGDRAIPAGASFTSAGQATYQIVDDVFCGDGTYPGSAGVIDDAHKEGMLILFSVLDEQYNELTDADGNEVRVHIVRDSTNTTDVYKTGFVNNPVITFKTIDSNGADLINPYTIPAAQEVRVLYGSLSNIENLPVDAFTKFKLQSASEVEAGSFLQDGTRKMTGDGDWDGNKLLNPLEIVGGAAADLLIRSQQELNLQDQHLISPVPLSQSDATALLQPTDPTRNPSVLGALNSQISGSQVHRGNRAMNRTGVFVSNPTGPAVDYPDLDLMVNGEVFKISAGTKDLTGISTGVNYVFYNPTTNAIEVLSTLFPASFPVGGILLWRGDWNGAAWSDEYDVRWPSNRQGTHEEWYVGDGVGADFTDLNLLRDVISEGGYGELPVEDTHKSREIVVCGTVTLASTFFLDSYWTLRGLGRAGGTTEDKIVTSSAFNQNSDVIFLQSYCTVKNLTLEWGNTSFSQVVDNYGIRTGLFGCLVDRVVFKDGAYSFWSCASAQRAAVQYCDMSSVSYVGYGVDCLVAGHVSDCDLGPANSGDGLACARIKSDGSIIERCTVSGQDTGLCFFHVTGDNNTIRDCSMAFFGGLTVPVILIYDDGSYIGLEARNNRFQDGFKFISSAINNSLLQFRLNAADNHLVGFEDTVFDIANVDVESATSRVKISGNHIQNLAASPGWAIYVAFSESAEILNNKIAVSSGDGIELVGTRGLVDGNSVEATGFGVKVDYANYLTIANNTFNVTEQSVLVENSGYNANMPFIVSGNRFIQVTSGYAAVEVYGFSGGTIIGNAFGVSLAQNGGGVKCVAQVGRRSDNHTVTGNSFYKLNGNSGMAQDAAIDIEAGAGDQPEGCAIGNNTFESCGEAISTTRQSSAIFCDGDYFSITGNVIRNMKGPPNTSSAMFGIRHIGGYGTVTGNTIYTDLTDSGVCHGNIAGISTDGGWHTVTGNSVFFTGSGATSTVGTIWGVSIAGNIGVVSANHIGDFDISTALAQLAISAPGLDNVVTGNFAARHDISAIGSGGMVLGNVARASGSVNTGTHATSGNVSNP